MGVVLLQILQWVLRIILFLLLLIVVLVAIVLIVPIRYRAEGEVLEKKPGVRGTVTWFFYLIYMKFCYEEEFRMQVRVFGIKVYDSVKEEPASKPKKKVKQSIVPESNETDIKSEEPEVMDVRKESEVPETTETIDESEVLENNTQEVKEYVEEDELTAWEKEMETKAKEEARLAKKVSQSGTVISRKSNEKQNGKGKDSQKERKSLADKITELKTKIQDVWEKIKNIINKIEEGKLKVEHYLELWNRKETQVTFQRAKVKLGKIIKAVLPRKWLVTGEVGFADPSTTGQFMGALGAMYPMLGNKVRIVPDFENQVMNIEGNVKGHIRLANLVYQIVSLVLNRQCFKFIKLVFDELGSSKKDK